jgi:hypothetical protein
MSYCWYCYWGWPDAIASIYERAAADLDALGYDGEHELAYGPTHCVWCDENFDGDFGYEYGELEKNVDRNPPEVIAVIRRSLDELRALPEELREPPKGFAEDDENCEGHPPPEEWKVRRTKL